MIISGSIIRSDNVKGATVNLVNEYLTKFEIELLWNTNFFGKHPSQHGVHLSNHGKETLPMRFMSYIKKL